MVWKYFIQSYRDTIEKYCKKYIKQFYKINCLELKDLNIEKLIKIKVNKKQIGSDRLANAIAATNNKDNFIILDFGTATTFDVLIKNVYHGGVIAPGLKLSLNMLISNASLIPHLNLKKINKVIGSNTVSAVRSGFYWGYVGLINNIVNLIKKETRKSFKIIITTAVTILLLKSSLPMSNSCQMIGNWGDHSMGGSEE